MTKVGAPKGKTRVCIYVPDSLLVEMQERAKIEGWNMTTMATEAIKFFLKN